MPSPASVKLWRGAAPEAFAELRAWLTAHPRPLLLTHERPDGDAEQPALQQLGKMAARRLRRDAGEAACTALSSAISLSEFHAPQASHWPCHLA